MEFIWQIYTVSTFYGQREVPSPLQKSQTTYLELGMGYPLRKGNRRILGEHLSNKSGSNQCHLTPGPVSMYVLIRGAQFLLCSLLPKPLIYT